MKNLMLDIETLSTRPNAAIVEMAWAFFDEWSVGAVHEYEVSSQDAFAWGGIADSETLGWWSRQPRVRPGESDTAVRIQHALEALGDAIREEDDGSGELRVWAKSPSFDCVILQGAFERLGMKCPWHYAMERDVRTLLRTAESLGAELDGGAPAHVAWQDVAQQVQAVQHAWGFLAGRRGAENIDQNTENDEQTR